MAKSIVGWRRVTLALALALARAVAMAVFLVPFLLAGLLILVAPLPQLVIHARWCYDQPGPVGWVLLLLGAAGATAVAVGLVRGKAAMHRAGMVLIVVPVVGVALYRAAATGDWGEVPLLEHIFPPTSSRTAVSGEVSDAARR